MCRSFGGEALIDATVRSIIIENGRAVGVRVSNTDELEETDHPAEVPTVEIRAKNVVCGTSVYNLYKKLLPQGEKLLANITCHFPSSRLLLEHTYQRLLPLPDLPVVEKFNDSSKRTIRQSNGHVFLFCKIRGDPDEINLPKNNVWYFNGYDLDEAFDAYFTNPTEVRPPTVYIGFPCRKGEFVWMCVCTRYAYLRDIFTFVSPPPFESRCNKCKNQIPPGKNDSLASAMQY